LKSSDVRQDFLRLSGHPVSRSGIKRPRSFSPRPGAVFRQLPASFIPGFTLSSAMGCIAGTWNKQNANRCKSFMKDALDIYINLKDNIFSRLFLSLFD